MIKFATHTAHLLSWIPDGHEEVLYVSPNAFMEAGKPIRGGVPVCWPWFARREGYPSHGTARTSPWKQLADNKFKYVTNEANLELEVIEDKNTLTIKLTTQNTTFKRFDFTQALHTYFKIGDINKVYIKGHDGQKYYDKVTDRDMIQKGPVIFNGSTDRIYLTSKPSILIDPVMKREILVAKEGSGSTVIWNPGAEKSGNIIDFTADGYFSTCCIEAANTRLDPVQLPAQESYELIQILTVNHLN